MIIIRGRGIVYNGNCTVHTIQSIMYSVQIIQFFSVCVQCIKMYLEYRENSYSCKRHH